MQQQNLIISQQITFSLDKTNFIKFTTKKKSCMCLKINLRSRSKKCLDLQIDTLNCSMIHTDYITPEKNSSCTAVSTVMPFMKKDNLKSFHFAYIQFIIYGFMFWGNLADSNKV